MPAENSETQLRASMMTNTGAVGPEFQQILDLATRLGDRLPGTTADFIDMMTMLRRQGMTSKAILGGLGESAAYLGIQLRMPVTAAAEFASKMQDATQTAEGDMMGLMDTIQRTYYLGVDSDFRRWGVGRKLIWHCEDWLGQFGAPKVQLMVRAENSEVARFYEAIGYEEDSFRFFYRRTATKRHREQQSEAP